MLGQALYGGLQGIQGAQDLPGVDDATTVRIQGMLGDTDSLGPQISTSGPGSGGVTVGPVVPDPGYAAQYAQGQQNQNPSAFGSLAPVSLNSSGPYTGFEDVLNHPQFGTPEHAEQLAQDPAKFAAFIHAYDPTGMSQNGISQAAQHYYNQAQGVEGQNQAIINRAMVDEEGADPTDPDSELQVQSRIARNPSILSQLRALPDNPSRVAFLNQQGITDQGVQSAALSSLESSDTDDHGNEAAKVLSDNWDKLQKIKDPTKRAAMANNLLKREGVDNPGDIATALQHLGDKDESTLDGMWHQSLDDYEGGYTNPSNNRHDYHTGDLLGLALAGIAGAAGGPNSAAQALQGWQKGKDQADSEADQQDLTDYQRRQQNAAQQVQQNASKAAILRRQGDIAQNAAQFAAKTAMDKLTADRNYEIQGKQVGIQQQGANTAAAAQKATQAKSEAEVEQAKKDAHLKAIQTLSKLSPEDRFQEMSNPNSDAYIEDPQARTKVAYAISPEVAALRADTAYKTSQNNATNLKMITDALTTTTAGSTPRQVALNRLVNQGLVSSDDVPSLMKSTTEGNLTQTAQRAYLNSQRGHLGFQNDLIKSQIGKIGQEEDPTSGLNQALKDRAMAHATDPYAGERKRLNDLATSHGHQVSQYHQEMIDFRKLHGDLFDNGRLKEDNELNKAQRNARVQYLSVVDKYHYHQTEQENASRGLDLLPSAINPNYLPPNSGAGSDIDLGDLSNLGG